VKPGRLTRSTLCQTQAATVEQETDEAVRRLELTEDGLGPLEGGKLKTDQSGLYSQARGE